MQPLPELLGHESPEVCYAPRILKDHGNQSLIHAC
jgi:hypothetical protein